MRILPPDFWERRVLPVVMAFGIGVLAHDIAGEHRTERELRQLRAALVSAQDFADACFSPAPRDVFDHAYAAGPAEDE